MLVVVAVLEHMKTPESDRHSTKTLDCKRKAQCAVYIIRPDSNSSTHQLHLIVRLHRKLIEQENKWGGARRQ